MSLVSLYDEASLWMTPSGAEDGKLFSQLPTDGSGDFTFSRGSNLAATRVGADGLIEKGRENLLFPSKLTNGVIQTRCSITTGVTDPYGGAEAVKFITSTDASTSHYINKTTSIAAIGQVMTMSVTAKANGYDFLRLEQGNNSAGATFELTGEGTIVSDNITASIQSIGDGWYRCSATMNTVSTSFAWVATFMPTSSISYTGDGVSGGFLYGAQLELGLVATDYIETGASTAQAGVLENEPRLDYSGGASCPSLLLEPQRQNLFANSEYIDWWDAYSGLLKTANAATSPDGGSNAYKLYANSASSKKGIYKSFGVSASATSFSLFAKAGEIDIIQIGYGGTYGGTYANINLTDGSVEVESNQTTSVKDYGNGWYRITAVATPTAGTGYWFANITDDPAMLRNGNYVGNSSDGLYIFGAQLELGSYPTSYIPTYGTSQTRSKEQCNVNSVSGKIGQTQGTFFLDADLYKKTNTEFYIAISDGTLSNSIYLHQSSQSLLVNKRISGATEFLQLTPANWSSGRNKCAITYTATEMKIFVNGVLKDTETINGLPSGLSKLTLGSRQDNLGELASDADYKQALLFPTALTDSECIALTKLD